MRIEYLTLSVSSRLPSTLRGGVVSLGKFDGVHRGHAAVLKRVKEYSVRLGTSSIAIAFNVQPISILRPDLAPASLCTFHRKADLISELGVETLAQVQTDRELLKLSASEFFEQFFVEKMGIKMLVEGSDFTFGQNRNGTPALLSELCEKNGIALEIVSPMLMEESPISSSRIRSLIQDGQIATANTMLTQPYRLTGNVVHGEHRGRTLGFPTANLDDIHTILPKPGVYACSCKIKGKTYPTATHIGVNPTFGGDRLKIEAFLIGFEGDLYGQMLHVDFHERIRNIIQFDSSEMLVEQMNRDIRKANDRF